VLVWLIILLCIYFSNYRLFVRFREEYAFPVEEHEEESDEEDDDVDDDDRPGNWDVDEVSSRASFLV